MKAKLVIILGPTAVGKSALALELAAELNGEIVNADSQQVYRYLDIGTGKPSNEDRRRVPHHVIDIVNPDEEFNAALFRRLAMDSVEQIHKRGRSAIVCGGTGFYLKALTQGLFVGPGQDPKFRERLARDIREKGLAAVYQGLVEIDPTVASTIHPNDRQRIIRALEVYELSGKPLSRWQKDHAFGDEPYRTLKIGLNRERGELYDQINQRCTRMIQDGLLDEVRGLIDRGYGLDLKPMRSVGYRQMGAVIKGIMRLDDAAEEMKQETRHLAKRQLTWFRGDAAIHWFHPQSQQDEIIQAVTEFIR